MRNPLQQIGRLVADDGGHTKPGGSRLEGIELPLRYSRDRGRLVAGGAGSLAARDPAHDRAASG